MFFFCWYFDFLCKFKISNGSWCIDKTSFYCILPVFSAVKWRITDKNRQMHVKCMQNMSVSSWIENIEAKNFVRFQLLKFMIHLARVANFMVIFSASYTLVRLQFVFAIFTFCSEFGMAPFVRKYKAPPWTFDVKKELMIKTKELHTGHVR